MSLAQSIKKGFSTARSSGDLAAALFGFALAFSFVNIGLSSRVPPEGETDPLAAVLSLISFAVYFFLSIFFQGGTMGYVTEKIRTGRSALEVFASCGRRFYLSFLAVTAITFAITLPMILLMAAIGVSEENPSAVLLALAVTVSVAVAYVVARLFFAFYAVAADGVKTGAALKRSFSVLRVNPLLFLVIAVFLPLLALGYLLFKGLREKALYRMVFVRMAILALFMLLVLILSSVIPGMAVTAVSLVAPLIAAQIVAAVIWSALSAFLGVWMTATFMSFYLGLPQTANPNNN